MVRATFDRDRVDVVVGGLELAQAFSRVRWDHLLYTGSPAIGREIAKAAAEQLVPVTLELGGKCPAILTADSVDAESVKQVLGTKALKNGQMCISVDYCLVPRDQARGVRRAWPPSTSREAMPELLRRRTDCTGIISERHLERIERLLEEARARGLPTCGRWRRPGRRRSGRRVSCRCRWSSTRRTISSSCGRRSSDRSCRSSPTTTLDEAIDYVNAGERPAGAVRVRQGRGGRRRRPAPDDLGRRVRQRRRRPRRAAVAAVRRHRPERLGPPPRHRGLPRVLQPARGVRPRRGRPDRGVRAAVRADRAGGRRRARSPAPPDYYPQPVLLPQLEHV